MAVLHILKNKNRYNNIVIWQPMIGFILFLIPKYFLTPKIIITTLLYSPARIKKGSIRAYFLKQAVKKADALLYFSYEMAEDVRKGFPKYSDKIFSTYLPIIATGDQSIPSLKTKQGMIKENSVFSGGQSDRDFETVIDAFNNTDVPVTIVCTQLHRFRNPKLITNNFTILRGVSEEEYHSLVKLSSFVVIALENEYSSCGQLLFTFCMKNRIPIIATDCFGTRDYITHNINGVLVPVKDGKAIFNAYSKLVSDIVFRDKIVDQSYKIAEKMTFENYLKKIYSIIGQLN